MEQIHRSLCNRSSLTVWNNCPGFYVSPQVCYRCLQLKMKESPQSVYVKNNTIFHPANLPIGELVCPQEMHICSDGHCVSDIYLLQGEVCAWDRPITNCQSGLDGCDCGPHMLQCNQGNCIPWHQVGDVTVAYGNIPDYNQGSDMQMVHCESTNEHMGHKLHYMIHIANRNDMSIVEEMTNYFLCNTTGVVVDDSLLHDLIPDCPHSEDEVAVFETSELACKDNNHIPCMHGHPRCYPRQGRCVYDHNHIGHLRFCRNGVHLQSCSSHLCTSMFKCPLSYCLPVHKLCDSVHDCPNGEDELECNLLQAISCPGFVHCWDGPCIHVDQSCDGKIDCPRGDDEVLCHQAACLGGCTCLGTAMACGVVRIMDISHVDLAGFHSLQLKAFTLPTFKNNTQMKSVDVSRGNISLIIQDIFLTFSNLLFLDMSNNRIVSINSFAFKGLINLKKLHLQGNPIKEIAHDGMQDLNQLVSLDLSYLFLTHIGPYSLKGLHSLQILNLTGNNLVHLNFGPFIYLKKLQELDISRNPYTSMAAKDMIPNSYRVISDSINICCKQDPFVCSKGAHITCPAHLSEKHQLHVNVFSTFINLLNIIVLSNFLVSTKKLPWSKKTYNLITLLCEISLCLQPSLVAINNMLIPSTQINRHGDVAHVTYALLAWLQMLAVVLFVVIRAIQTLTMLNLTRISSVKPSSNRITNWSLLIALCLSGCVCLLPLIVNEFTLPELSNVCSYMFLRLFVTKAVVLSILVCAILITSSTLVIFFLISVAIEKSRKAVTKFGGKMSGTGSKFPILAVVKSVLYQVLVVFWIVQLSIGSGLDSQIWLITAMVVNSAPLMFHHMISFGTWVYTLANGIYKK